MAKKIYDIKPPKVVYKPAKEIKESLVVEKKKVSHVHHKKESNSIWVPISFFIFIVVLITGTYLFFKLPKANISIWPKVNALSYQQTITASKLVSSVDLTNNVIPAQYFQAVKTEAQDFPATGSASDGGEASGTIIISNKFDPPTPFNFKAGTHFMSDSGKLFVAMQKIAIPAAKKVGSKITAGTVQIQIQAVEAGTDYNIAPSNFSIPGLKGTASYYSVSAASTSAMTGGYTGKVKKVTDDDIQGAKDVLNQKTTADAMTALKSQISSDYILLDNAVLSNVTNSSTKTKAGTVADSFNYQTTVTASALGFKKSDLDQFAKNYVISQIPQGQTLFDKNLKADYSAGTVDVSGGKIILNLNISAGDYQNIDKNSVSLSLLGENADQIKETINSSLGNGVSKIQVNFWPFWVANAPNSQSAVNVELKFQ